MAWIDGAVLFGRLRFLSRGAATSFHGDIAVDLLHEGLAAIRHALVNYAQRASLADRCAGGPILGHRLEPQVPQARGRVLRGGAAQCAKWLTDGAPKEAHMNVIGRAAASASGARIETFLLRKCAAKVL